MESILAKLDLNTRTWAASLSEDDIAHILSTIYKLPDLCKKQILALN